jgi:hypothetical protein
VTQESGGSDCPLCGNKEPAMEVLEKGRPKKLGLAFAAKVFESAAILGQNGQKSSMRQKIR